MSLTSGIFVLFGLLEDHIILSIDRSNALIQAILRFPFQRNDISVTNRQYNTMRVKKKHNYEKTKTINASETVKINYDNSIKNY